MTTKQAYLDALNSGRRRRPTTSIEELNRTLADLETRISQRTETPDAPFSEAFPTRLAAEIETQRQREESIEAAGSIASELKLLRDDLNAKIAAGIEREFAAVKSQIEDARAAPAACRADELSGEVERLGGMIDALAARGGEDNAARLQAEMETIRQTLAELARESTLQSVERRWDELDRRLDAFTGAEPELMKAIQTRLEEIGTAVGTLPEPAAMHALDDKLKILAAAMDRFAQKEGPLGDGALTLIDERLDEISRAIAASASAGRGLIVDGKPFERIEARIGSLAKQIEELVEDRPAADIGEQIAAMSKRIDEIAARETLPNETITRLAEQMSLIAGKVDAIPPSPDLSEIFQGVETRFAAFSRIMDERNDAASSRSTQLFAELDQRLTALTERLEAVQAGQSTDALMLAMDERFAAFADTFETRLNGISQRLESTTATLAAIDPDLVRSLEAQVKNLSEAIQTPSQAGGEFEDVAPRLERLEQMIADNHLAVLDAARSAAEDAVRSMGEMPARDNDVVQGLADDLRALESLARRSDERNTKTFEAIHDTLLKIVERLGAMEHDDADDEPARLGIASAPTMQADVEDLALHADKPGPIEEGNAPSIMPEPLTPREAAHLAVEATKAGRNDETPESRSMIARVLGRKAKDKPDPAGSDEATAIAPVLDLDAPIDPAIANQPIEPGLGSPDLNAIMRRVRDEREAPHKDETPSGDSAKADFIAAARRAAQAAAAEAESLKSGRSGEGSQRFSLLKLLKSRNRVLTLGVVAVTLALTGFQISKTMTADDAVASFEPVEAADTAAAEIGETETETAGPARQPAAREVAAAPKRPDPTPAVQAAAPAPVQAAATSQAHPATGPTIAAASRANADISRPSANGTTAIPAIPQEGVNAALRAAAEAGDPKAFFEIGNRYAEGRGVTEDLGAAARWYERAANAGLAPAQYRLANMLEKATGVERDVVRAMELYEAAAARGNASAMHNLAVLHAMGANGRADNAAAARNFGKAAELGIRDSQFNLAILAAKGVGMSQDLVTAYKWLAIVAEAGDTDAAAKRDEIAALLPETDLEKAKKTVELWQPKATIADANAVSIPAEWGEDRQTTASIDMGEAIRQVQAILNANGYDAGTPDGIIGARTVSAISAFQKDNQMQPTGQIDEPLVRALLALS